MFLQHDGAPAYYAVNVRSYLDEAFQDRWIDRLRDPPRSPNLNPLDFFFWGFLKNEVYCDDVTTPEEVVACIHGAVAKITPDLLRRVQDNIVKRLRTCVSTRGGHIDPLLV
ncbi:uncharacterized protein LOC105663914 [Megachile rotundata]|uniref:uncharacterized protein LOC105663914 n=1 Tax=Megachile rotundata TaxID=143995 RepID=UPI003FCFF5D8